MNIKNVLVLCLTLTAGLHAQTYERPAHVSQEVWEEVSPYFLPFDHPLKAKLDKIFTKSRALQDTKTLKRAGFLDVKVRKWTRLVVAKHAQLSGYLVKLYMDKQHYHHKLPEHYFWLRRIEGAALIRAYIKTHQLEGIFKVPKKWIYPLPEEPSPPASYLRKNFILIVEDMNIYEDSINNKIWGSKYVTHELLNQFYQLLTSLGFNDCSKPENAPFSKDGRIALIDTQTYYTWPIKYDRLLPYLSPDMQTYWQKLTTDR